MFKDLSQLMKQANQMQEKLAEVQKKIAELQVTGKSGGGMVAITMAGDGAVKAVSIDPSLVTPQEKEVLEDLLVAAFNDAKRHADELSASEMGQLTSGLQLPPGFKLPF